MPNDDAELIRSIGFELVSRVAPEELPLFTSLAGQLDGTKGRGGKASSDDQILGFGIGEAVVLLTPMILEFARAFWDALAGEAAGASVRGVLELHRR